MMKLNTHFKHLFSICLLLLIGSQLSYGYTFDLIKSSPQKSIHSETDDARIDGIYSRDWLTSSSLSANKKQHIVVAEENIEEEEEKTVSLDSVSGYDYTFTSFLSALSLLFFLYFSKKKLFLSSYFSYLPSYRRYLVFEVFRI